MAAQRDIVLQRGRNSLLQEYAWQWSNYSQFWGWEWLRIYRLEGTSLIVLMKLILFSETKAGERIADWQVMQIWTGERSWQTDVGVVTDRRCKMDKRTFMTNRKRYRDRQWCKMDKRKGLGVVKVCVEFNLQCGDICVRWWGRFTICRIVRKYFKTFKCELKTLHW